MPTPWDPEPFAEEIRRALQLEDDAIIDEVLTAESKAEAIRRIEDIERDAQTALSILTAAAGPRIRGKNTCDRCGKRAKNLYQRTDLPGIRTGGSSSRAPWVCGPCGGRGR